MTVPPPKGVLFDVDGTLLDTNYLHVLAWARAFRDCGREATMAELHALIGMGSDKLIERFTGAEDSELDEAHSKRYAELGGDGRSLPGAAAMLRETKRRGGRVVLGTSAKGHELEKILDTLAARDAVDVVVTSADVEHSKPDPDIFRVALERSGLSPQTAIAVGDTVWDIKAAAELGLRTVGVTTGGIAREVLSAAGAVEVYSGVDELLRRFDESSLGRLLPPAG